MTMTRTNAECTRNRRPLVASAQARRTRPRADRLPQALADYVADELAARRTGNWL